MSGAPLTLEGYVAEKLPEPIRSGLRPSDHVRVVVQDRLQRPRFLGLRDSAARPGVSVEEAVARVRTLRDEWD